MVGITNLNKKRKMRTILLASFLLFLLLSIRIGWIQFVSGGELQNLAYKQQTLNRSINPRRGTIFDATRQKCISH